MNSPTDVLFLEIDAGNKNLILEWARAGVLPTVRSLLDRGLVGHTKAPRGFFVGSIWPSLYTGVSPARHGIHSLAQLKTGSYEIAPNPTGEHIKREPFWSTEWARGKCGMKALQYIALGIAPVVAPIGVNTKIVRDGVNGFWAATEEEWVDRISLLLGDAALRARMGAEARRTVEQSYSHRVQAPRMARVFREAAAA